MRGLTPAQERALLWLPEDGSYSTKFVPNPDRPPFYELQRANLIHGERLNGNHGGRIAFRLTQAGIEARRAIKDRTND